MHLQRNFYEVLGLPTAATTDEIKQRYRELARKFHPDLVEDKVLGQRIFTQINRAYSTLKDPERRSQYDATLNAPSPARAAVTAKPAPTVISGTGAVGSQNGAGARQSSETDKMVRDADMAMIQGQAANAKAICDAVLKVEPQNAQALSILGDALQHLKKSDEAIKAYRKSLSIAPSSIVSAKLARIQSMSAAADAAARETVANGARNGVKAEPEYSGGFISRLLRRK